MIRNLLVVLFLTVICNVCSAAKAPDKHSWVDGCVVGVKVTMRSMTFRPVSRKDTVSLYAYCGFEYDRLTKEFRQREKQKTAPSVRTLKS